MNGSCPSRFVDLQATTGGHSRARVTRGRNFATQTSGRPILARNHVEPRPTIVWPGVVIGDCSPGCEGHAGSIHEYCVKPAPGEAEQRGRGGLEGDRASLLFKFLHLAPVDDVRGIDRPVHRQDSVEVIDLMLQEFRERPFCR